MTRLGRKALWFASPVATGLALLLSACVWCDIDAAFMPVTRVVVGGLGVLVAIVGPIAAWGLLDSSADVREWLSVDEDD